MSRPARPGPRLRAAILVAFGVWLALLAVAFGGQAVRAPDVIVKGAVVIWAGAALFLAPGSWLVALVFEEGIAPRSRSAYAVRMAPYTLVVGSLAFVVGVLLLVPSSSSAAWLRIAGVYWVVWGAFALFVGVTALRKKRRQRSGTRV